MLHNDTAIGKEIDVTAIILEGKNECKVTRKLEGKIRMGIILDRKMIGK